MLTTVYAIIAVLFLVLTFLEGQRKDLPWSPYRVFGLMLCAVWPVLLLYVLATAAIEHYRERPSKIAKRRDGF
jgi:Ca2+/Na+ antiporter